MKRLGDILQGTTPPYGARHANTRSQERNQPATKKRGGMPAQPKKETVEVTDVKGKQLRLVKSRPKQYELFSSFLPDDQNADRYSNTIELYDVAPKYFISKKKMQELRETIGDGIKKRYLDKLVRHFEHRGKHYTLTVHPAFVEDQDGEDVAHYPSETEEFVEEALRKIACDNPLSAVFLNGKAGLQFTGYQLQQELKRTGHSMNWPNLWKSLQICAGCRLTITARGDEKEIYLSAPLFPVLAMRSRKQYEANPKDAHCYVEFNPLVTASLQHLTYRQYDYITCMDICSPLARWLFRRLSHYYTQAHMTEPYNIKLSTIVRNSGMVSMTRPVRHQMADVETAIKQLKGTSIEEGVSILSETRKTVTRGLRGKIEEVHYTLYPHFDFVVQAKKANRRQQNLISQALEEGLIDQKDAGRFAQYRFDENP